jgi:hypothetical protein
MTAYSTTIVPTHARMNRTRYESAPYLSFLRLARQAPCHLRASDLGCFTTETLVLLGPNARQLRPMMLPHLRRPQRISME